MVTQGINARQESNIRQWHLKKNLLLPTNFENNMTEPLINEEVLENYKQSLVSNKKSKWSNTRWRSLLSRREKRQIQRVSYLKIMNCIRQMKRGITDYEVVSIVAKDRNLWRIMFAHVIKCHFAEGVIKHDWKSKKWSLKDNK